MRNFLIVIIVLTGIIIFQSCEEPVRTELTKEEKELVDSLYAKRVGYVRKKSDSICDAQYQSIFDAAKDSFYQNYMKEIEELYNENR